MFEAQVASSSFRCLARIVCRLVLARNKEPSIEARRKLRRDSFTKAYPESLRLFICGRLIRFEWPFQDAEATCELIMNDITSAKVPQNSATPFHSNTNRGRLPHGARGTATIRDRLGCTRPCTVTAIPTIIVTLPIYLSNGHRETCHNLSLHVRSARLNALYRYRLWCCKSVPFPQSARVTP
jgi:hypothetical protein